MRPLIGRTHCENWDSDKPEYLTDVRTGKTMGILMPQISQRTAEASPGIASWSHPRAKGGPNVKLQDGGASVVSFSDYCKRHLLPTYPHTRSNKDDAILRDRLRWDD